MNQQNYGNVLRCSNNNSRVPLIPETSGLSKNNIYIFYMILQNIQNLTLYKWLLIASFFSALTIISIKYHLKYPNHFLLLVTVLSETGLIYSYIQMLQYGDILTGFSLVKIISILIVLFPSIMFLGVELTNRKIVGLIFAFLAIYLLA